MSLVSMSRISEKYGVLAGLLLFCIAELTAAAEPVYLKVVDSTGAPVPDAIVYLDDGGPSSPATEARSVVDQIDEKFVPQLTVIQTGTIVEFPNSDSVSHHVYSFARPNSFELPLYKGQLTPEVRFDHPGIVTLGCNIHDTMLGYIVVVDSAHFGITDADGAVTISGVSSGFNRFFVWSQRLDPARPLQVDLNTDRSDTQALVIDVGRRLRTDPRAGGGSLAWEDY
jgi:plastocyanin